MFRANDLVLHYSATYEDYFVIYLCTVQGLLHASIKVKSTNLRAVGLEKCTTKSYNESSIYISCCQLKSNINFLSSTIYAGLFRHETVHRFGEGT